MYSQKKITIKMFFTDGYVFVRYVDLDRYSFEYKNSLGIYVLHATEHATTN